MTVSACSWSRVVSIIVRSEPCVHEAQLTPFYRLTTLDLTQTIPGSFQVLKPFSFNVCVHENLEKRLQAFPPNELADEVASGDVSERLT